MNRWISLLVWTIIHVNSFGQKSSSLDTTVDFSIYCDSSSDGDYLLSYEKDKCLPFKMDVPKGTQLFIGEWSTEIKLNETFHIEVMEGDYKFHGDGTKTPSVRDGFGPHLTYDKQFLINKRKESTEANDINVLQEYIYEDDNGFIAKTEVFGTLEHHFFFATTNGKVAFTFENVKGRSYSEFEARLMYESLKTIVWNE